MSEALPPTVWAGHRLDWGQKTHIMGIINVTPDSFAGDGLLRESSSPGAVVEKAVEQALAYVAEGAAILDIGGESTRPGAEALSEQEELARVMPVITALRAAVPQQIILSVDTYKAEVARKALDAGADLVNDIRALRADPSMAALLSEKQVPVILMANLRGQTKRNIVSDVIRLLAGSIDLALAAGVRWEHLIIDPGIGFGTTPAENLTLLRRLGELRALGRPILLGTSRKSTIGKVLGGLEVYERGEGTAATVALGIAQGVDIVRVHDVHTMLRIVKMSDAIVRGTPWADEKNP